ncbi:hypothetical protein LUZ62_015826 [Rhynchospora pubera]|uniref:Cytochrome P450 n=1 Tax=Rhynchospora pubera TaxID=906938 RepID=A0AAV8GGA9_9POAL|nr:hypothetical protein LUZ62_015826 [Rhynchospora pubera]
MLPVLVANLSRMLDLSSRKLRRSNGNHFFFHGPWFLGMSIFVTANPVDARHLFIDNFQNYPKGKDFYEIFELGGDGIFIADGDTWKYHRVKAQMLMSNTRFRVFVAQLSRQKIENALHPFLVHASSQNKIIDIQDMFLRLSFDMSTNFIAGVDLGILSRDLSENPIARAIDEVAAALFFRFVMPRPWWKLLRALGVGHEKRMVTGGRALDRFVAEVIEERRREIIEGRDAPPSMLRSYMEETEVQESYKFLRETIINFLFAARDTTSAAMTWFLWAMCRYPHVEEKIIDELNSISKSITSDGLAVFEAEQLEKLIYFHASILESLRLHPSTPLNIRSVLKPDTLPTGVKLTPGMKVVASMYAMGRMKTIWGDDCLEFKPERWISKEGELKYEPSYKFLPFHTGPRSCLGKQIALTQIKMVIAVMVYNFSFEIVEGHVPEPKFSFILHMKNGLMVRVKKR